MVDILCADLLDLPFTCDPTGLPSTLLVGACAAILPVVADRKIMPYSGPLQIGIT